jgi:hypothetical protein
MLSVVAPMKQRALKNSCLNTESTFYLDIVDQQVPRHSALQLFNCQTEHSSKWHSIQNVVILSVITLSVVAPIKIIFILKNLFGTQDVYLTATTPFVKTLLFFKPTNVAAFHSHDNKEKCFWIWEMHEGVVDLIHFCYYQLTVVTNQLLLTGNQFITTFMMLGPKPAAISIVNHDWSHNFLFRKFIFSTLPTIRHLKCQIPAVLLTLLD